MPKKPTYLYVNAHDGETTLIDEEDVNDWIEGLDSITSTDGITAYRAEEYIVVVL